MANTASGIVTNIDSKTFPPRHEDEQGATLWSFQLEGNNKYYRTGKVRPTFSDGDSIEFTVNDKGYIDLNSVTYVTQERAKPSPKKVSTSVAPRANSKDSYWADKEARDIEKDVRYQNVDVPRMTMSASLNVAASVVNSALERDAIGFGNTAKSKRLEMLGDFVEELANRFYIKIVETPDNPPTRYGTEASSGAPVYEDD